MTTTQKFSVSPNANKILKERYYAPGENFESMCRRCSFGNDDYFNLMVNGLFFPNSPTLFNAGLPTGGTLSACFVFDIADTLLGDWPDGGNELPDTNSIIGTKFKAAAVAKAGGGVGYYFGNIRKEGSDVRSVHRKACGPVAVLRDLHSLRSLITQGGKRDLAQMGVLPCYHPDIRKFIHSKDDDPKGLESFNISVSWKDDFIKRAVIEGVADDSSLWHEQCESAWKTGCPGMFFWDTVNRFNPNKHLGYINAPNPCGETPNRSNEPCNLGSIAVNRCFNSSNRDVDWNMVEELAYRATWFLDEILDNNKFPHPDITAAALLTRKLGLGVMGWANLLAMMHIHYDTDQAIVLGERVMKLINDVALQASIDMAKKKGPYKGYSDKTEGPFCRNETRTSIAPTGTIAILAEGDDGCWGSIEPFFSLDTERTTKEGIKMRHEVGDKFDGFTPKIASEIHWKWHVSHQACFQKHTNLGVSKTINMPNSATKQDISDAYQMMWATGCKGGTVFRDGCRDEQVLVARKASVYTVNSKESPRGNKKHLPDEVQTIRRKFKVGGKTKVYLHVGLFDDGTAGEIFVRASKAGSSINGMLDTWAMVFSNALQYGTPLKALVELHKGSKFEPSGMTGDKVVPVCSSIPDLIVRWLETRFLSVDGKGVNGDQHQTYGSGEYCPDCGNELVRQAGCLVCLKDGCRFSSCG